MVNKFTAAEAIRRLAQLYEPMVEAADALEEMGKLEQTVRQAGEAKLQAESERDVALADLKKAKDAVAAQKVKAADMLATASDQALAKLQEADQKAQAIADGAAVQAQAMVAAAVSQAEQAAAPLAGQVAQLTSTKVGLEQDLASIHQASSAKQAEVEALEIRLAKAQASIAKLLG